MSEGSAQTLGRGVTVVVGDKLYTCPQMGCIRVLMRDPGDHNLNWVSTFLFLFSFCSKLLSLETSQGAPPPKPWKGTMCGSDSDSKQVGLFLCGPAWVTQPWMPNSRSGRSHSGLVMKWVCSGFYLSFGLTGPSMAAFIAGPAHFKSGTLCKHSRKPLCWIN